MASIEDGDHFVAHLKIEHVDRVPDPKPVARVPANSSSPTTRRISEVTHIVIKSDSLEKLKARFHAHVELVEED